MRWRTACGCVTGSVPVEQIVNGTPAETCRAICPYSKTKVFVGSEIGAAVAQDGQRYAALETAFLYRKQLVANCTCNGKDAFWADLIRCQTRSDFAARRHCFDQ